MIRDQAKRTLALITPAPHHTGHTHKDRSLPGGPGFRPVRHMARWTGLEPATPGVTGRYSNRLSYHRACRAG